MKKRLLVFAITGCISFLALVHAQSSSSLQQSDISYGEYMEMCTDTFRIGLEAKTLLRSGESPQAVTDELVSKYAYGPNGEVLRNSSDTEIFITEIVAHMDAYIHHPENYPAEGDYSSQAFLADCHNKALRHSQ